MADPIDYQTASAGGLAKALAARQVSALELFDEAVATIEAKDAAINAVVAARRANDGQGE
jgi:Asp-tRNA(Asn)/Glu-tRNA(Gln) amidotransferase A subunit family amidase